jgi:DNA-binding NarL/FixJ family response regulator
MARSATPASPRFTEREVEVLRLVAQGLSNDDIAGRLTLSERIVRTQVALYALKESIARLDE